MELGAGAHARGYQATHNQRHIQVRRIEVVEGNQTSSKRYQQRLSLHSDCGTKVLWIYAEKPEQGVSQHNKVAQSDTNISSKPKLSTTINKRAIVSSSESETDAEDIEAALDDTRSPTPAPSPPSLEATLDASSQHVANNEKPERPAERSSGGEEKEAAPVRAALRRGPAKRRKGVQV